MFDANFASCLLDTTPEFPASALQLMGTLIILRAQVDGTQDTDPGHIGGQNPHPLGGLNVRPLYKEQPMIERPQHVKLVRLFCPVIVSKS